MGFRRTEVLGVVIGEGLKLLGPTSELNSISMEGVLHVVAAAMPDPFAARIGFFVDAMNLCTGRVSNYQR